MMQCIETISEENLLVIPATGTITMCNVDRDNHELLHLMAFGAPLPFNRSDGYPGKAACRK